MLIESNEILPIINTLNSDLTIENFLNQGELKIYNHLKKVFFPITLSAITLSTKESVYFSNYYLNRLKDLGLVKETRLYNKDKNKMDSKYEAITNLKDSLFIILKRIKDIPNPIYSRVYEILQQSISKKYLKVFEKCEYNERINRSESFIHIIIKDEIPNYNFSELYYSRDFKYQFEINYDYSIRRLEMRLKRIDLKLLFKKVKKIKTNTDVKPNNEEKPLSEDLSKYTKAEIITYMNTTLNMNVKPLSKNKDNKESLIKQVNEFIEQNKISVKKEVKTD